MIDQKLLDCVPLVNVGRLRDEMILTLMVSKIESTFETEEGYKGTDRMNNFLDYLNELNDKGVRDILALFSESYPHTYQQVVDKYKDCM